MKIDQPSTQPFFARVALTSALVTLGALTLGCAARASAHGHTHGETIDTETEAEAKARAKAGDEDGLDVPAERDADTDEDASETTGSANTGSANTGSANTEDSNEASAEGEVIPEPKEAQVARAALHRLKDSENPLGLVLAVGERTSDLPWVLAIQNRSEQDVRLAALPSLIQFDVTPAPPETETEADKKPEKPPEAESCGGSLPKSVAQKDTVVVPAGGMLIHAFDPRSMCENEALLKEGASVALRFGFPLETKKLWKNGTLTEVEVPQKAPFLAERVETRTSTEANAGLKYLEAEPFVLGRTYPLSEMQARAEVSGADPNAQGEDGEGSSVELQAPPPPLQVKIYPLGTSEKPENGLVRVRVQNVSQDRIWIHLRREAFSYEVVGPAGSATCVMLPRELAASQLSYSPIGPGGSLSISTRLAEACPPGVWDQPGTYTVAVRFAPSSNGEESRDDAFIGVVDGSNVATLVVPGDRDPTYVQMRVIHD